MRSRSFDGAFSLVRFSSGFFAATSSKGDRSRASESVF